MRENTDADVAEMVMFTVAEVRQVLRRCVPGKASGPDGIPSTILKSCSDDLAEPLCDIFNQCLKTGYIP